MDQSTFFWQTYLHIEKEVLELAKFIYFTDECNDAQLNVYSPYITDLLIRVCVEIEAISKELYFRLNGDTRRGDVSLMFDTDCLKSIDLFYKTSKKTVHTICSLFNFIKDENKAFKPLKEAHKRSGNAWERAYQSVKHDRYRSLKMGTIKNLIRALGALYFLNIYYRNQTFLVKFNDIHNFDYSFGSSVFAISKPKYTYINEAINGSQIENILQAEESPYILKFTLDSYQRIINANKKLNKEIKNFLCHQPEMKEELFINIIKNSQIDNFISIFPELGKYRINKKIPNSLPFEERKKLFIESDERNSKTRFLNEHKEKFEISEENIQEEIENAGKYKGFELYNNFINSFVLEDLPNAMCELVIDDGKVKYDKF